MGGHESMKSRLFAKGAEAYLYLEDWYGYQVIRKHRVTKSYRISQLDNTLRSERTIREARMLNAARQIGVRTPIIFRIIPEEATIVMEYIEGDRLKECLSTLSSKKRRNIFSRIGKAVAHLHLNNLAHGDLTTSNIILHPCNEIYLVDFGLASTTHNIEDFGTDLHLYCRALQSTHYMYWQECYEAFKQGYHKTYGKHALTIFKKVQAIESRGRYIAERFG